MFELDSVEKVGNAIIEIRFMVQAATAACGLIETIAIPKAHSLQSITKSMHQQEPQLIPLVLAKFVLD